MAAVTLGGLQAMMREIEELEEESIGKGKGKDKGDDKDKDKTNIGGADPKHDKDSIKLKGLRLHPCVLRLRPCVFSIAHPCDFQREAAKRVMLVDEWMDEPKPQA